MLRAWGVLAPPRLAAVPERLRAAWRHRQVERDTRRSVQTERPAGIWARPGPAQAGTHKKRARRHARRANRNFVDTVLGSLGCPQRSHAPTPARGARLPS